jgi:predicted AAA+ superfamily ATPase
MELRGYQVYRQPDLDLAFWRTASGQEVDFVLGEMRLAVEVKASARAHDGDLGGLRALGDEQRVRYRLVVYLEEEPRRLADGIEVVPWRQFLDRLREGDFGV